MPRQLVRGAATISKRGKDAEACQAPMAPFVSAAQSSRVEVYWGESKPDVMAAVSYLGAQASALPRQPQPWRCGSQQNMMIEAVKLVDE